MLVLVIPPILQSLTIPVVVQPAFIPSSSSSQDCNAIELIVYVDVVCVVNVICASVVVDAAASVVVGSGR